MQASLSGDPHLTLRGRVQTQFSCPSRIPGEEGHLLEREPPVTPLETLCPVSTLYYLPDAPAETLKKRLPTTLPSLDPCETQNCWQSPFLTIRDVPLLLSACDFGSFFHSIAVMLLEHSFSFVLIFLYLKDDTNCLGHP